MGFSILDFYESFIGCEKLGERSIEERSNGVHTHGGIRRCQEPFRDTRSDIFSVVAVQLYHLIVYS